MSKYSFDATPRPLCIIYEVDMFINKFLVPFNEDFLAEKKPGSSPFYSDFKSVWKVGFWLVCDIKNPGS